MEDRKLVFDSRIDCRIANPAVFRAAMQLPLNRGSKIMVRFFLISICFFCFHHINAQEVNYINENENEMEVGNTPEKFPIYRLDEHVGNLHSLLMFLSDSIVCPLANCDSISGRVIIQFIVQKNGEISDIKIVKGINEEINKAAIRVINRLECIKPAITRKKPVQYKEVIPITIYFKKNRTIKNNDPNSFILNTVRNTKQFIIAACRFQKNSYICGVLW